MKMLDVSEVRSLKESGNVHVNYYWYDHMWLRENGDADIVTEAINQHDFDDFKRYADWYNAKGKDSEIFDGASDAEPVIFFPSTASVYDEDAEEVIGDLNIMNREAFELIDSNEYECG